MSRIGRWSALALAALVALGGWFALPVVLDAAPAQSPDARTVASTIVLFPIPWTAVRHFDVQRSYLLYGCLISNGLTWGFVLAWVATKIGILPSWEEYDYLADLEDDEFEEYDSEPESLWRTWLRWATVPALMVFFPLGGLAIDREGFGAYDYVRTRFEAPNERFSNSEAARLSKMRFLRELDLAGTNVNDDALRHVRNLTRLERIDLSGTSINGRLLDQLQGLNRLEELNLRDTSVGNIGMKHIERITSIQMLDVGQTNVSDRGVASIAELPNLSRLSLDQTRITDEALGLLSASRTLRELNLRGTSLDRRRVEGFRRENPHCTVDFP